jgi:hypothetical protein
MSTGLSGSQFLSSIEQFDKSSASWNVPLQRDWRIINHALNSPRYEMALASIPATKLTVSFNQGFSTGVRFQQPSESSNALVENVWQLNFANKTAATSTSTNKLHSSFVLYTLCHRGQKVLIKCFKITYDRIRPTTNFWAPKTVIRTR